MKTLKLSFQFALTALIPLLYLLNLWLAYSGGVNLETPTPLSILGMILALCGVVFWILSMVNLGGSFGVLPQKQKKVKTGLYKYFNHPMYIGISATIIGISITNLSWPGLVFFNLFTLPMLLIRARLEEKKLS